MSDMTTLLGGTELEVTFADGSKETIKVRQIPVEHYPRAVDVVLMEGKLIELYCDKPETWWKRLTGRSYNAVLKTGREINEDFFEASRRQGETITANRSYIEMVAGLGAAAPAQASPSSAPTLPRPRA